MKLIQENLAKAAALMGRLTPKTSSAYFPDLNCIRLTNAPGALVLTMAHGEGGAQVRVAAADTSEPLDVLAPARTFDDLIKTCAAGEIIEINPNGNPVAVPQGNRLTVKWPHANSHIAAMEPGDGVGVRHTRPMLTAESTLTFDADVLRGVIPQVAFAAATDEARPILTGLLLEAEGGDATLSAANGFHLMQVKFATARPAPAPLRVILPAKFCGHLTALLSAVDAEDTQVTLSIANNSVLAQYGPCAVWGQLMEGEYPDLHPIIPKTFRATARLPQGAALRVVKGAQAINKEQAAIQLRAGLFAMYASDPDVGDTHPLSSAGCGDLLTVFVNPKSIGDAIRAMPKGELEIKGNEALNPVVISPNANTLYILMPMHPGGKNVPPEPLVDLFTSANLAAQVEADEAEEGVVANAELHALAAASYSGDKLSDGKIKKPFIWKSAPYICVGTVDKAAECERLVPMADWKADTTTYLKAAKASREAEIDMDTKGVIVAYGVKKYVLSGERLTVTLPETVAV